MRATSCEDLYVELLTSSEFAQMAGFDLGNAFDGFWKTLSELRPDFMRRYMRKLHGHPTEGYPQGYE